MTTLSDSIACYLTADPHAREVSIQLQADGNYEVTLTDLNRDWDAETPRCIGATVDVAMDRALEMHEREEERANERQAAARRIGAES